MSRYCGVVVAVILVVAAGRVAWADPDFAALGIINVKNLKAIDPQQTLAAVGDGRTDDTAAIQAAVDLAKKRTFALKPEAGSYLGSSAVIYFPAGRYVISDEISLGAYANVLSDSRAIIEQKSPDKRSFVFNNVYTVSVRGLRFVGGRNQIWFDNKNIDSTMLEISDCEFQLSGDYAIYTHGTASPADPHMSANLTINRCKFIRPRKVLRNVCDYAMVRDTWVTIGLTNFDRDSAAFLNTSGVLMFENMIGVPVFGTLDEQGRQSLEDQGVDRVRWIDNYGSLLVDKSRFGGEFGGIPIVHHFGLPDLKYPKMGQSIAIESSWICAGPRSRKDSAVVTLRGGLPLMLRIEGNSHLIDGVLVLNDGLDLVQLLRANPDLVERIHFSLEPNSTWPAASRVSADVAKLLLKSGPASPRKFQSIP